MHERAEGKVRAATLPSAALWRVVDEPNALRTVTAGLLRARAGGGGRDGRSGGGGREPQASIIGGGTIALQAKIKQQQKA